VTLYGKGEAVAVSSSAGSRGGTAYLGKDILGSTRSVTGGTGQLEDRHEYDAFGTPYRGGFDSGMTLGYTGKPYDSTTKLYNYGYRDYAPMTARFTTVDPIRDGNNWFAYVNNDPVNWVDPWGLEPVSTYTKTRYIVFVSFSRFIPSSKTVIVSNHYSTDTKFLTEFYNYDRIGTANQNAVTNGADTADLSPVKEVDSSLLPKEITDRLGPGKIVITESKNGGPLTYSNYNR
jgi:RHS repeat-associated protein